MTTSLTLVLILHLFMRDMACLSVQETQNVISVTLGEKIVLNCSARDGQIGVFWFWESFGMTPTVITYFKVSDERGEIHGIHGKLGNDRRFQVDNKDGRNYLQITQVEQSDSGVYHCIGVFQRQTVFLKNVTVMVKAKLSVEDEGCYAEYVLGGGLVLSGALILGLAFSLYALQKKYNSLCAAMDRAGVSMSTGPNGEDQDADSLHYAAVTINPPAKQKKTESTDCVYPTVQPH